MEDSLRIVCIGISLGNCVLRYRRGHGRWVWSRRLGWVEAVFKEGGHIMLNLLELVELEVRVDDGEDVAGFGLFVDEDAVTVANKLFLHSKEAFAFEHDGQDVTRGI